jgi:hypothetical protein
MKTKLNRKRLFGHRGQILAWLIVTFVALSLPVASLAQSGGPGTDHGIVDSIDDMKLDIRGGDGRRTRTYTETDETQWLNKRGQRIDAGDVVGKMVEVRFRWITGGSEALSVQITSSRESSQPAPNTDSGSTETRPSHRSEQVLRGEIGGSEAVFRLTLEDGKVSGTYSQRGKSYRIEGTYKPGHMSLDEYTGERLTAHIKLTLDDLETTWTGTMYNVYPNKSQYPVSLSKSH